MGRISPTLLLMVMQAVSTAGSSTLSVKQGTQSCSGELALMLFKTDQAEYSYGSTAYVSGQINALSEMPSLAKIDIKMGIFGLSFNTIQSSTVKPCNSNSLMPPAGSDAGYACPEAGLYNFYVPFQIPDKEDSFYSNWHGFNVGMTVEITGLDGEDVDYATCNLAIHVGKGEDSSSGSKATYGYSLMGLAGLAALVQRKRRQIMMEADSSTRSSPLMGEESEDNLNGDEGDHASQQQRNTRDGMSSSSIAADPDQSRSSQSLSSSAVASASTFMSYLEMESKTGDSKKTWSLPPMSFAWPSRPNWQNPWQQRDQREQSQEQRGPIGHGEQRDISQYQAYTA